jgi:hypothetical protein
LRHERVAHGAPIDGRLRVMRERLLGRQIQVAAPPRAEPSS